MVVLLAIAGSVAAVLLSRAGEETSNLEETDSAAYGITNETGCQLGGHSWTNVANATAATAALGTTHGAGLTRAGLDASEIEANKGYCHPTP